MTDSTVPRTARLLRVAGLVPPLAVVVIIALLPAAQVWAATAGVIYGAVVASIIGAAWWRLAVQNGQARTRLLVVSLLPALMAWPAILLPPATGLLLLAVVFASLLPTDRRLVREGVAPGWWMALRRPLSWGLVGLYLAGAAMLVFAAAPGVAHLPW